MSNLSSALSNTTVQLDERSKQSHAETIIMRIIVAIASSLLISCAHAEPPFTYTTEENASNLSGQFVMESDKGWRYVGSIKKGEGVILIKDEKFEGPFGRLGMPDGKGYCMESGKRVACEYRNGTRKQ